MPNETNTGTRAYVPGKQVTVAHLIAHPAPEICEKAGIPDVDAIGILTLTPGETAIIAGDMAVRSADVNVAFLDRFSGTLILYGSVGAVEQAISQTVLACTEMSQTRTGALIVFEREMQLDDMVRSGTVLDAAVSGELLKNIFFVKAPMHDGAVIVRHGRVLGAGCMLPLSKNVNLSRDLGMRHRAGIGMSENSDAVVVIVSEETGSISVAIGGMLKRHLKPETLENLLRNELLPREEDDADKPKFNLLNLLNLLKPRKNGGADDDE